VIGRVGLASLAPVLGAVLVTTGLGGGQAEAKTPGKTYCFYGKCHRVKTIDETEALVGTEETINASHYDSCKRDRYNPCGLTSSGAEFDSEAPDNAASPIYPDGTTLLVWSPATQASLVLRVNNAGPYWGDRKLDVSRRAAEVLGFAGEGVATLKIRVIDAPTIEEATYKKNRTYDPVPGYIGQYASLDDAQSAAATAYMVAGLSSPFGSTTVALGAGNPTQVAGSSGTQSGAAMVPPTVLAAAEAVPSDLAEPVATAASLLAPVKVAGFVKVAEVEQEAVDAAPTVVASHESTRKQRSYVERASQRNSRSYRLAARKQREREVPSKPVAVADASSSQQGKRRLMQDGTNDMSIFSRHTYAGVERIAAAEPEKRRRVATARAKPAPKRYASRDTGDRRG
jgi:rare lipoprotein A